MTGPALGEPRNKGANCFFLLVLLSGLGDVNKLVLDGVGCKLLDLCPFLGVTTSEP